MLQMLLLFSLGLVLIIGISSLFITLFQRRFEECAPLAICALFLLLYALTLAGLLRFALPAAALLAGAGMLLSLIRFFRKKDPGFFSRLLTPGLAVFFGVSLVCCLLINATVERVHYWDEYSHWIIAVKELWLVDAGEAVFRSVVSMPYYPPFTALINFFFLKITGGYSEPMAYAANIVIAMSLLVPLLRTFPWKKWFSVLFVAAAICIMPLILFTDAIASLYVDCLMGLLIAYVLFIYFAAPKKDRFTWLSASAGICMLSMIKNIGVEICVVPLSILAADCLFVQRKSPTVRRTKKQALLLGVACALVMFLAHGVWHTYLRLSDIGSDLVGGGMGEVLSTFPQDFQLGGIRLAFSLMLNPVDRMTGRDGLSIIGTAAVLLLVGLFVLYRARGTRAHKSLCFFFGGTTLGLFAYTAGIVLAMILTFTAQHVVAMYSFERYIDTYLLAMLVSFTGMLLERRREENTLLCSVATLCALLPFTSLNASLDFLGTVNGQVREERIAPYATAVDILDDLDPASDKVCYIEQGNTKFGVYYLRYALAPLKVEYCGAWNIGDPSHIYDMDRSLVDASDWADMVLKNGCNYLFVRSTDAYFNEHFAQFFESAGEIAPDTLYRVTEPAPGRLLLVRVD